jgi:ribosome-binding factor A
MANPGFPRARRLAGTLQRLITEWLEHQPADRQLGFVTVTDVRVSGDLRHAKVYWTVLESDQRQATADLLAKATPEARTWVAQRVRLRYAPTLEFLEDDVALRGAHIDRLLAELGPPDADPPTPPERPPA